MVLRLLGSQVSRLRQSLEALSAWLTRFEPLEVVESSTIPKQPMTPEALEPPMERKDEIEAFLRAIDYPDEGNRRYVEIHMERFLRTLTIVPPPSKTGRVLELGAYMQMTPVLGCVLGYPEVRGAYFGKLGKTDGKTVSAGGHEIFRCLVDLFDAEKDTYPYPGEHFDTVLACEIFEHFLHDPMHMLLECRRVLCEGGTLVLTTPNAVSYTAAARVFEMSGNPQLYSKYADPRGEYVDTEFGHMREYTPQELQEALSAAGFEVITLFTRVAPGYHAHLWVRDFLQRVNAPTMLRGEQMFVLAKKNGASAIQRYPPFLYDGVG